MGCGIPTYCLDNVSPSLPSSLPSTLPLYFTGLSGAGKTMIAFALEEYLVGCGIPTYCLDNVSPSLPSSLPSTLPLSLQDCLVRGRRRLPSPWRSTSWAAASPLTVSTTCLSPSHPPSIKSVSPHPPSLSQIYLS